MADVWDLLEAKYGGPAPDVAPSIPAPSGDVWDMLEAKYGSTVTPEAPGFLESIGTGIRNAPGALYDAAVSIPSGVSNVVRSIWSPQQSLEDGTLETTARGVGGIAAGVAGGAAGAAAGAPLAPFTFGLSVPVGAAIGGGLGLLGFNKANQLTGSDEPTTLDQDIAQVGTDIGMGVGGAGLAKVGGAAIKGGAKVTRGAVKGLEDASSNLTEKGLGVQYGHKKRGLDRVKMYVGDDGQLLKPDQIDEATKVQAPVSRQVDLLKERGFLDKAPDDPGALDVMLKESKVDVGKTIGNLTNEADAVLKGQEILPDFQSAQDYIKSFRDTTQVRLNKEFKSIVDDYINHQGDGFKKLTAYLDKLQKETNFDQATPKEVTTLKRLAAYDLRRTAEAAFDEALPHKKGAFLEANENFAALSTAEKTINTRLAKQEPGILDYLKGGSLPVAAVGGALSVPLGVGGVGAAGLGVAANAIKKGWEAQRPMSSSRIYGAIADSAPARASLLVADKADAVASLFRPEVGAIAAEVSGDQEGSRAYPPTSTPRSPRGAPREGAPRASEKGPPADLRRPSPSASQGSGSSQPYPNFRLSSGTTQDPLDIAVNRRKSGGSMPAEKADITDDVVKAVIKQESSGKANAVGPKTKYGEAKGLMQLLDSTGKEWMGRLGMDPKDYDPFDAALNVKIGSAYLKHLTEQFSGDLRLALAAYNWGPGNLSKLIKRTGTKDFDELQKSMPSETRTYVRNIIKDIDFA